MKHECLLNKRQSLLWRNMPPWQRASPVKNTPYFVFSCLYLKNELWDPHFSFLKSNQRGKMKLSAKFKKILSSGFRAILILWFFKVALNLLDIIFLKFAESFIVAFQSLSSNKKGGSPSSFLRYEQLNPKYRVFFLGFPVAKVTYCITIMITSCLKIFGFFLTHVVPMTNLPLQPRCFVLKHGRFSVHQPWM